MDKFLIKNILNYIDIIKYNLLKKKIEYNSRYQIIYTNIFKSQFYSMLKYLDKLLAIISDHYKLEEKQIEIKIITFISICFLIFGIYSFLSFELLMIIKSVLPKDLIINVKSSRLTNNNSNWHKKYIQIVASNLEIPYHFSERSFYHV
jgi:hypothetical protein